MQIKFVVNLYEPTCIIEHKQIPERPYHPNKVSDALHCYNIFSATDTLSMSGLNYGMIDSTLCSRAFQKWVKWNKGELVNYGFCKLQTQNMMVTEYNAFTWVF